MRQIRALLELSPTCSQHIRYDCVNAVFEFNDVQYSWWNDKNGRPQYYWAGNNDTVHTCSCGINGVCVETSISCNCDASASVELYDEGFITNKDHLPITRLNFGRTSVPASMGVHTLGPLRCSGSFQSYANVIPASCTDLWRGGETVSGLYIVKVTDGTIVTVFCDMSKLPDEEGYQTLVGTIDVKSTPVYFTAVRETNYATLGIIPYEKTLLNIGGAMDIRTGKFTAPRNGIYFFEVTLCSDLISHAFLYHNSVQVTVALTAGGNNDGWNGGSAQATIELRSGDVVYTYLGRGATYSSISHHTHFTGYLLQEL